MLTFTWMCHQVQTSYADSSVRLSFANSWQFAAQPAAPDQRIFTLSFQGFQYYVTNTGAIDSTTNANINNMAALEAFYLTNKCWQQFIYPHPILGNVTVRFNKPLVVPKGIISGMGTLEDFTMEMVEQP